jgi:hypothetical protein
MPIESTFGEEEEALHQGTIESTFGEEEESVYQGTIESTFGEEEEALHQGTIESTFGEEEEALHQGTIESTFGEEEEAVYQGTIESTFGHSHAQGLLCVLIHHAVIAFGCGVSGRGLAHCRRKFARRPRASSRRSDRFHVHVAPVTN